MFNNSASFGGSSDFDIEMMFSNAESAFEQRESTVSGKSLYPFTIFPENPIIPQKLTSKNDNGNSNALSVNQNQPILSDANNSIVRNNNCHTGANNLDGQSRDLSNNNNKSVINYRVLNDNNNYFINNNNNPKITHDQSNCANSTHSTSNNNLNQSIISNNSQSADDIASPNNNINNMNSIVGTKSNASSGYLNGNNNTYFNINPINFNNINFDDFPIEMATSVMMPSLGETAPSLKKTDRQTSTQKRHNSTVIESDKTSIISTLSIEPKGIVTKRNRKQLWTKEEDEILLNAIEKHGVGEWMLIAEAIGNGRTRAQCSQRWSRVLNPSLNRKPWAEDEDERLLSAVSSLGIHKWTKIADAVNGRCDVQCRYRYIQLTRKDTV